MELLYKLYILFVIIVPDAVSSNCKITDDSACVYTVTCIGHAGSTPMPSCSGETNVTFNITGSVLTTLTSAFFGSTNFDSRVRRINAYNNSWSAIEENSFRYFTRTVYVDLSNNKIRTINKECFKSLIYLQDLRLSHNYISSLSARVFYRGNSKDLKNIDLSHNEIVEISKTTFSIVPELENLDLSYNFITSILDDSFYNLDNLTSLKLQGNRISSLGMTLVYLRSLEVLDLSLNRVQTLYGYEINRLVNLKSANFSFNDIQIIQSDCFKNSIHLETLDLSYNYIKTNIDNVTFANNKKISYLNLYGNGITKIEDSAFANTSLTYFDINSNNLTMEFTAKTLRGLKNITNLNFYNQTITGLRNQSFSELINLAALNMSRNLIEIVEKHSFINATSLTQLDFSFNFIKNLGFLCCLPNLTELFLNNNKVEKILQNDFEKQSLLLKLDLSFNNIIKIEPNSLPLTNLQYFFLYGNSNLTNAISMNVFSNAKFLRNLDLSHLGFTKVEAKSLINLPAVAKLNISNNHINFIDPDNFDNMDNMYSLDISYNLLTNIELNQPDMKTLKALYLNNNKISNISNTFVNASNLFYLDLSNNYISDLSNVVFENLSNLKVLHLSNNKIMNFNNVHTNTLKKLTDFRIDSNCLNSISLKYYSDLVSVDLKNNSITHLNVSFLEKLDSLQSLDISSNKIKELQPGTFKNVKILKFLNLSSNYLQTLRFGSLRGLHRTEYLDLSNNKISKLDIAVFHECTELKRLIIDNNKITSIDIQNLILNVPTLEMLSLGGNPISCNELVRNVKFVNRTFTRFEVTSIDKIYHEDNAFGITCGDLSEGSTDKSINGESKVEPSASSSFIVLVWCLLSVIVLFALAFGIYLYKNGEFRKSSDSSIFRYRQSLELNKSDCSSDLLS